MPTSARCEENSTSSNIYYTEIPQTFFAGFSVGMPATGFSLIPFSPSSGFRFGERLDYRPASHFEVGFSFRYKILGASFVFTLPPLVYLQTQEGRTSYMDYHLNYYGEKFGIELGFSDYKGYLIQNSSSLSSGTLNGALYYLLPDLENIGGGITGYYVFSPATYSLGAGFDQSKRQLRSAGSALLTASFRYQEIRSPTTIIPPEKQTSFGPDGSLNFAIMKTLAVGGGYAYTFVHNDLFASGALAADLGPQFINYGLSSSYENNVFLGLNAHARINFGINQEKLLAGASLFVDGFTEGTHQIEILYINFGARAFVGYRMF